MHEAERRRESVLEIFSALSAGTLNDAPGGILDRLFSPDAVHHTPTGSVGTGPGGAYELYRDVQARHPGVVASVKRSASDGDIVAVHWHASTEPHDEFTGEACAAFFRFAGDRVVEHWELHVDAPARTVSGRSVFSDAYPSAPGGDATTTARNRDIASTAFARFLTFDPAVVADHWGEVYLQHNESIPDGLDALLESLEMIGGLPAEVRPDFTVIATAAGDDLVWFLERVRVGEQTGFGVDIFRLADGRIVEHWDIPAMRPPEEARG